MSTAAATALTAPHAPTPIATMNMVLLALFGAGVVWSVISVNHWFWLPAVVAGTLANGSVGRVAAVISIAGFLVTIDRWPLRSQRSAPGRVIVAAVTGAGLTQSLLRMDEFGFSRWSAIAVAAAMAILAVGALAGANRPARRAAVGLTLAIAFAGAGVTAASAYEALRARADMETAVDYGRDAAEHLTAGEAALAVDDLERARSRFERAEQQVSSGWSAVAQFLPLVGHNVAAIESSAAAAVEFSDAGLAIARSGDPLGIVRDGRVSLERTEALGAALDTARLAVERGQDRLDQIDPVWIAPPLYRQVATAVEQIDDLSVALTGTADGLAILPRLVGEHGPRTYLVVIGNPAEARDLGGFAAGFALIEVDRGAYRLIESGRPGDLLSRNRPELQEEFPTLVGDFPNRYLEMSPWRYGQNLTAVADLSTLARAANQISEATRGIAIDGAIYLDPFALEALVPLIGPIALPEFDLVLDGRNTASFFLFDQYVRFPDKETRNQILDATVSTFTEQLDRAGGSGTRPSLDRLIEVLAEQRLAIATLDDAELSVLDEIGVSGRIAPIEPGRDYLAVSHLNGGPNKLDAFLERSISYEATVGPTVGTLHATVTIELTNTAPAGLSSYVSGNSHGYPTGTNRAVIAVHTPHEMVRWTGPEAEPALTRSFVEFERKRHERVAVIAPGQTVRLELELIGQVLPGDEYGLDVGHQPLVNDDHLVIDIDTGTAPVTYEGILREDTSYD
ncbi:MAG: DUF4012 domain-containing protein [Acidimicrobiales bacterium]|nr:DUF4012 domain-containing protein [Acidimicrobiales bacterium]